MMSTQQDLSSQAPLLSDSAYVSYGSYQADGRDRDNVREAGDSYSRQQPERWNEPSVNLWRVLATFYSFIVVGANDGAYGVSGSQKSIPRELVLIGLLSVGHDSLCRFIRRIYARHFLNIGC